MNKLGSIERAERLKELASKATPDGINDADWELARELLRARERLAWGPSYPNGHTKWPERKGYSHNPVAAVDLALAEAKAVREYMGYGTISAAVQQGCAREAELVALVARFERGITSYAANLDARDEYVRKIERETARLRELAEGMADAIEAAPDTGDEQYVVDCMLAYRAEFPKPEEKSGA